MEHFVSYFSQISILPRLGGETLILYAGIVILVVNYLLTLLHSKEEWSGYLWSYFGAIAGLRIVSRLWRVIFFIGLTSTLWIFALVGLVGLPFSDQPQWWNLLALGLLVGARVGDWWHSHEKLAKKWDQNPGLPSGRFYLMEAIILTVILWPGVFTLFYWIGFIISWFAFYSIVPGLKLIAKKGWFQSALPPVKPWPPWEPRPLWTLED
jgi:hypothetical protein